MRHEYGFRLILAFAAAFCLEIGVARAEICEATVLRDIPNPFIRKGDTVGAITQFLVNKKTGRTSYCS
jgi:hypothetical protein